MSNRTSTSRSSVSRHVRRCYTASLLLASLGVFGGCADATSEDDADDTADAVKGCNKGGSSASYGGSCRQSPIREQPPASAALPKVTQTPSDVAASLGAIRSVTPAVLEAAGYQQREIFISGSANAYRFVGAPGKDGRWNVEVDPGSAAPYTTRLVVFTPKDPRRFTGTVVTEWANVTAGSDALPDLIWDHSTVFRNGDAYVGVSAQFVGVASAKSIDPARYDALSHPGDSWSYDIFSQAGMAVWRSPEVLGGLRPVAQIAVGESQSAGRMAVYIDALAPRDNVYNGYLVHSRGGSMFSLQQASSTALVNTSGGQVMLPDGNVGRALQESPQYAGSRTDLVTPVLYVMSETDVFAPPFGALDYGPATQENSRGFRLWEIAGTAHIDDTVVNRAAGDLGDAEAAKGAFNAMLTPPQGFPGFTCDKPINTGEHGYVLSAALVQLIRWTRTGGAPSGIPAAEPPLFAGQSAGEPTGTLPQRDKFGNILGGVRTPAVDVPVAALTGVANTPDFACALSGTTEPLSPETLKALYPTHDVFEAKWCDSVGRLARQGFLTFADAQNLSAAGKAAAVPSQE